MFRDPPPSGPPDRHVLPSERRPTVNTVSPPPAVTPTRGASKNDLFALNWSPVTPNLSGPYPPSPPVHIPPPTSATDITQTELPPTPPSSSHSHSSLSVSIPLIPSKPSESFNTGGVPMSPPLDQQRALSSHHQLGEAQAGAGISENPVLDARRSPRLRLRPTREYLLGEGRCSSVYLGAFQPRDAPADSPWTLCAAKRLLPDQGSQVAGLGEAFILSKLASPAPGNHNIMRLHGVRDERDGLEAVDSPAISRRSSMKSLGLGRPPPSSVSQADERHLHPSHHTRTSSDIGPRAPHPLRRQASFASRTSLSPLPGSPDVINGDQPPEAGSSVRDRPRHSLPPPATSTPAAGDGEPPPPFEVISSRVISPSTASSTSTAIQPHPPGVASSPRIVLLLEFCPFGHVMAFLKSSPERMGKKRWLQWSRELTTAVAWAHSKGVLHADIKPQNILIASDMSLRLSDFSSSLFLSPLAPTDPLSLGTLPYSPPEFVQSPPVPFSFPSDIFSLGVTLSVMLSGREPYEGLRAVERIFWVSRGAFSEWEGRARDSQIGNEDSLSRTGSVRSIKSTRSGRSANLSTRSERPRSDSVESISSWVGDGWGLPSLAASLLASETQGSDPPTSQPLSFAVPPSPPQTDNDDCGSDDEVEPSSPTGSYLAYSDGTPAQLFLSGRDVVPQEVRDLLKRMTAYNPRERPTAKEVLQVLETLA